MSKRHENEVLTRKSLARPHTSVTCIMVSFFYILSHFSNKMSNSEEQQQQEQQQEQVVRAAEIASWRATIGQNTASAPESLTPDEAMETDVKGNYFVFLFSHP